MKAMNLEKIKEAIEKQQKEYAEITIDFGSFIEYFLNISENISAEQIENILRENSLTWKNFSNKKPTRIMLEHQVILRRIFFQKRGIFTSIKEERLTDLILNNKEKIIRKLFLKEPQKWTLDKFKSSNFSMSDRRYDLLAEKQNPKTQKIEEAIIIELKSEEGEGGFEQTLCYMQILKNQTKYRTAKISGILISGIEQPSNHIFISTIEQLNQIRQTNKIELSWFLYEHIENHIESFTVRKPLPWKHINNDHYNISFEKMDNHYLIKSL